MGKIDRPGLSRRALMAGCMTGAAALAAAGAAAATGLLPAAEALLPWVATRGVSPATAGGTVHTERVFSAARGRTVTMVTILPAGVRAAGLPVCVALHGLHGDALAVAAGGLPGFLSAAVAAWAARPFAVVAVDGGDSYWHQHTLGDDPMAMLVDELPRWLAERGLSPRPFAATGISMGGFGALHYARMRQQRAMPLRAVGVIAPALITTWAEMRKREAFTSAADWASYDPLRNLPALGNVPIGVWCGTEDRFIDGVRRFIATGRPQLSSTGPGGHDDTYFRTALPQAIRFIATHR